jgi:hypothetical protein
MHFLVGCSNFCKPLKKKSESCPSNQVSAAAMTLRPTRNGEDSNFFPVLVTGGIPTGPDVENRGVINTLKTQVGPFLLGCMCPVNQAIFVQEQEHFSEILS